MASGTQSNPLSSSQLSQLVFLTCGYFMLCVISSSSERANGRNIHIFQNSEVQPAFAEVECPSNLLPCTLSCNLMLSQLIFRPSCHDDATKMRGFQAILERLTEFIAYTLPLGQLFRCCLCGCIERKKSSVGVWETWLCLSPVSFGRSHCSQHCSPALLRVQCAQRLGLHTSRLPPAAAWFLDPISVTLMCVYCKYL